MSIALSDDASAAYHRFRQKARLLGSISHSFDALAVATTSAYREALSQTAGPAWATLVRRTALLVERVRELRGIVPLDRAEREALDFFAAIVRENEDLLGGPELFAAADLLPRLRFYV